MNSLQVCEPFKALCQGVKPSSLEVTYGRLTSPNSEVRELLKRFQDSELDYFDQEGRSNYLVSKVDCRIVSACRLTLLKPGALGPIELWLNLCPAPDRLHQKIAQITRGVTAREFEGHGLYATNILRSLLLAHERGANHARVIVAEREPIDFLIGSLGFGVVGERNSFLCRKNPKYPCAVSLLEKELITLELQTISSNWLGRRQSMH